MALTNKKQAELRQRRRAPLITPTDLSDEAARDIAGGMDAILADVFALYLKTNSFHWHMSAFRAAGFDGEPYPHHSGWAQFQYGASPVQYS